MDKTRRKKIGDRRDAFRVEVDAVNYIFPFAMPRRTDSEVYLCHKLDVTELLAYIDKRNAQNPGKKMTPFHAFVAATARIVSNRERLNRYICGTKYYQRHNIILSFVVKKKLSDNGEEFLMTMEMDKDDTLEDISRKINDEVYSVRETGGKSGVDSSIRTLLKLPRFVTQLVFWFAKFAHRFDFLPKAFIEGDTDFSTVLLTNLGSIKCGPVYHHLNNYGTTSIVLAIGEIKQELVLGKDGKPCIRSIMEVGATADERIADGFYFAKSILLFQKLFDAPELLNQRIGDDL